MSKDSSERVKRKRRLGHFPPSVPTRLTRRAWVEEAYREDRMLVDSRLFDLVPYRGASHVEGLVRLVDRWNRRESQEPLLFEEYNWTQRSGARREWRRCYGTPTDGTHRAAAAHELGTPTWVTVTRYAFEARGIERLSLPPDRVDLAKWLVPAGDPPRPAHEVVELSTHDPRTLIAKATPTHGKCPQGASRGGLGEPAIPV